MVNVLLIILEADIPAAITIASTLPDYRVYVFDPVLLDKLANSNLSNIKLIKWDNNLEYQEIDKWSHQTAFAIERELENAVKNVVPGISIISWQHLNFYYQFMAFRWYRTFWGDSLQHFEEDTKYHIFICDNPLHYYNQSFIPSLLLMQYLLGKGLNFGAYTYGKTDNDTDIIPNLIDYHNATEVCDTLVHVPTCMYDFNYINEELRASGKRVINFQAKYWNVPIHATKTVGLARTEDLNQEFFERYSDQLDVFFNLISDKLNLLLEPYIGSLEYRLRQTQHIANLYKSQLITYYLLEEYFKYNKPSKVLLSDHDGGFHGPITTYSENYCIPVLLIPHSKINADIEFNSKNVISLTHPIQGESISDRNGKRVLNFNLTYPEIFTGSTLFPQPVRGIGLLLTGLTLNGVFSTNYRIYINGIRKIFNWCKQNNIEFGIRCRPHLPIANALSSEIDYDLSLMKQAMSIPLIEFAKKYDLCLMYDTPTNGALEYLRNSIPILNPVPKDLARVEACICNSKIVPRGSVETILGLLDSFIADDMNFYIFKNKQFRDYVSLFNTALPLRHFL